MGLLVIFDIISSHMLKLNFSPARKKEIFVKKRNSGQETKQPEGT